ncbi:MAG TPA: GNAT family N-acetyltransferase [Gemmatimonadaceae bacterium]
MSQLDITAAMWPDDLDIVRTLFREYADSLGVSLDYQGFDGELRSLPGDYASPRGTVMLARHNDRVVGCVGVRPFDATTAEMKRLYVRPDGRGGGVGRSLAEAAIQFAAQAGYARMRLDTLPQMARAQDLYRSLGFVEIDPYRFSPVEGTQFLELPLTGH